MHKSRFIHEPQLNRSHRVIPIPKGGHDGVTAPEGADNINLLTNGMVNQALGVAGSDSNNYINVAQLPLGLNGNASANVEGLTTLEINQQTTYFITDYETFLAYTITAIRGVVSRVGDTITYTAPASVGPGGFIINGRAVNIPITASFTVNTPAITSPVNNATGLSTSPSFTSNAFGLSGGSDTHEGSDWQIATDAGFTNIVSQVTNSAVNKLSYNAAGLNASTTYYVRVRYKATIYGYSNWATAVTFTTQTANTVNQPSITSPANGATGVAASPSFTSTAFVVSSGSDTHEGSDWQIATDAGFTNIVAQTTNSAVNKTTYSIAGLSNGVTYYARVRYKGLAFGYSAWSSTVSFTVVSVPTYAVVPTATTLTEGDTVNFNITTSNVPNGTTLYWSINGNSTLAIDFTEGGLNGSVVINNNTASVSKTLANDDFNEAADTFVFNLRTGSVSGPIVANSGTITVNDISVSPNTAPAVTAASPRTYTHPTAQSIAPLGTVSDTELTLANNWNGASLSFVRTTPGGQTSTDRFVGSGSLTFQIENIIGVPTNTAQYNGTRIGVMSAGEDGQSGLLKITFNSSATTTIVQNVLRAVQYQSSIALDDSNVVIQITLADGNSGAQGSGGSLSDSTTVQMNQPNGTFLAEYCSGNDLYHTVANGSGGTINQLYFTSSTTCGSADDNAVNKVITLSSGDYLLLSNSRAGKVSPSRVVDTSFADNGYLDITNHVPTCSAKDKNLADHFIIRAYPNFDDRLVRYDNLGNVDLTMPAGPDNATVEEINTSLSSAIVCLGYFDGGTSDYRPVIYGKNHADGSNTTAKLLVKNDPSGHLRLATLGTSIYIFGVCSDGVDDYLFIQKRSAIDTIDTSFGDNGEFRYNINPIEMGIVNFHINSNGKILLVYKSNESDYLIRINSNGTIDGSFTPIEFTYGYFANNLYGSVTGYPIVADASDNYYISSDNGSVFKYSSNGTPVTAFHNYNLDFCLGSFYSQQVGLFRWNNRLDDCLKLSGSTITSFVLIDDFMFDRFNATTGGYPT